MAFVVLALFLSVAAALTMTQAEPRSPSLTGAAVALPSPLQVNDMNVTAGQAAPRSATVGSPINITATVRNEGDAAQTVQVNAIADSRFVGARNVTVPASESRSTWLIWETSGVAPGVYSIGIEAVPLPGETDLSDNTFSAGSVELRAPGPLQVQVTANRLATDVGETIRFTCRASEGVEPYRYRWAFSPDGRVDDGETSEKAFPTPGEQVATCTVTDNSNGQASASLVVEIAPRPRALAMVDQQRASPGTVLHFKALATGGTAPITFTWDFGDTKTGSGEDVPHAYDEPDLYTVTLTVADSVQAVDQAVLVISIAPLDVNGIQSATSVKVGEPVTFIAFATGGTGGPYTFIWEFGDGATDTRETFVSHSYSTEARYLPSVTVWDGVSPAEHKLTFQTIVVTGSGTTTQGALPYFEVGLGVVGLVAVSVGTVTAVRRRQRRRRWGPRPR